MIRNLVVSSYVRRVAKCCVPEGMNGLRDCGVVGIGTTDVTRVSESAAHKIKVVLLGRLALNRDEKRNKSQVGECMRGVPQYAADNMVKVRVAGGLGQGQGRGRKHWALTQALATLLNTVQRGSRSTRLPAGRPAFTSYGMSKLLEFLCTFYVNR